MDIVSAIVERARERVEEVRTKGVLASLKELRGGGSSSGGSPQHPTIKEIREKGVLAVLEEKFPKVREIRGGGGGSPELPTLKDIREKGILGVLEERYPRVKEMRERGILARLGASSKPVGEGGLIHEKPTRKEYVKPEEESRLI